jgi:transposase
MITLGPSQRYFLHRAPTDMRKSFDGLCGVVRRELGKNPLSGDVFVFVNRRRTHVKLLVWDRNGFTLVYKRLEAGTFLVPQANGSGPLAWATLMLMLEGVEVSKIRYRKRYSLSETAR